MFEIVPNWHPAAVHFPIALGISAALLLVLSRVVPGRREFADGARLMLYIAAPAALLAAWLGWQAYASVTHDAAGHLVMDEHRTWALLCTAGLLGLALWDASRLHVGKPPHTALLPAVLAIAGGLAFTGWLGGEMVYRHGVGVLLPETDKGDKPVTPASIGSGTADAAMQTGQPPVPTQAPRSTGHIHKDGTRHQH